MPRRNLDRCQQKTFTGWHLSILTHVKPNYVQCDTCPFGHVSKKGCTVRHIQDMYFQKIGKESLVSIWILWKRNFVEFPTCHFGDVSKENVFVHFCSTIYCTFSVGMELVTRPFLSRRVLTDKELYRHVIRHKCPYVCDWIKQCGVVRYGTPNHMYMTG